MLREDMIDLYESAASWQSLLASDDVCLVGGAAASFYAEHRLSIDHDHVVADLRGRFEIILDALESQGDWITNRLVPGKIILGELDGIEVGIRQLIRKLPLEVEKAELPSGYRLILPTLDETLRIKAYLIIRRNQTRDYLDVAALASRFGERWAAKVLTDIDKYYTDDGSVGDAFASQLVGMLSDPQPLDHGKLDLADYKGIDEQFQDWDIISITCRLIAENIVVGLTGDKSDD